MIDRSVDEKSFFDTGGFKPVSVGQRLRILRKEQGFSIKALAEKSGLAVNTLSLIENEKTSPSVSTLEQLAKALSIPLALFFEPDEPEPHVIFSQAGQRREILINDIGVEDCGIDLKGQPMQPFVVTLPPGKGSGSKPIIHTGHEFVYCISGMLEYTIQEKLYSITAGDSLFFEADLPHLWENRSESTATYFLILVPEGGRETPGEVHFPANG